LANVVFVEFVKFLRQNLYFLWAVCGDKTHALDKHLKIKGLPSHATIIVQAQTALQLLTMRGTVD